MKLNKKIGLFSILALILISGFFLYKFSAPIQVRIKYGYKLNQQDHNGWTPLHRAAADGNEPMLQYLLKKGVDKNARNKKGETSYHLALLNNFPKVTDFLKNEGVDTSVHFPILKGPYMGQKPPGNVPEIFLPGIISAHYEAHSPVVFSPDGKEVYWTEMGPNGGGVMHMKMLNGQWTYPQVSKVIDYDPAFSPDGKRLYFNSRRPLKKGETGGKENIWFMEKSNGKWKPPQAVGNGINANYLRWPCSLDKNYNLYFSDYNNIFLSFYINGHYQEAVNIAEAFNNRMLHGNSPCISPNGDFLLFTVKHSNHSYKLYISFKKGGNVWTDPIPFGKEINAGRLNGSPRLSPDEKYIFFVSAGKERPWGIYWVSSDIIGALKKEVL